MLSELFESSEDFTINQKIKTDIRKIAMNPQEVVTRAVALVRRVYKENGVIVPTMITDKKYKQYEENCVYAVKQLDVATLKGVRDDSWKFTPDNVPIT